ncbi:MAG: AAA family ATPase [Polyangiaceae bacterium]|nr:AAA family ATPase [Polyangiaceae bacterium]
MKARIEEIRLQNFRAIANLRLRLSDLTVLVGRNGAGKSSVLDAVEFMREAVTDSLPNALDRRDGFLGVRRQAAGPEEPFGMAVVMRVELSGRSVRMLYGFRITAVRAAMQPRAGSAAEFMVADFRYGYGLGGRIDEALRVSPTSALGFFRNGDVFTSGVPVTPAVPTDRLVLPLVASEQLWRLVVDTIVGMRAYEISPHEVASSAPIQNTTALSGRGSNAGDVLADVRSRAAAYDAVLGSLAAVTPGVVDIHSHLALMGRRVVTFQQEARGERISLNANHMSQGTLRALGILLALQQAPEPSLVLIDEIEDSIHPRALEALLEATEGALERFPVVLTTHSPEVLAKRQVTPARLRILQWEDGVTRLYRLSQGTEESVDAVTTAGDLLRINALWPGESSESFTGDLLELGDDA